MPALTLRLVLEPRMMRWEPISLGSRSDVYRVSGSGERMVGPEGFEPPTKGL